MNVLLRRKRFGVYGNLSEYIEVSKIYTNDSEDLIEPG